MLPFFLVGLGRELRRPTRARALLWLYLLVQTAVAMAFFVLPRYRLFLLPVVLLFAAHALVSPRRTAPSSLP